MNRWFPTFCFQAKVHKSLIPLLCTVRLYLVDGTMIKFRISKKVYGFATQEENLDNFLSKVESEVAGLSKDTKFFTVLILGYIYSIKKNYLHVNIRILFFQEHVGYEYFLKPHQRK